MIEKNQLRIGSMVEAEGKRCFIHQLSAERVQINYQQKISRTYKTYSYVELSGVILTDLILTNSGFSRTEQSFGIYAIGDKFYLFSNDGNEFFYRLEKNIRLQISTFHQLQNLYLLVTGDELKFGITG